MAKGENWDEWAAFDELYNTLTREPVEANVNYDMSNLDLARRQYTIGGGWGNPQLRPEVARQRADYAARLRMQQKLAEELRNQGVGQYNQLPSLNQQQ